MKGPWRAVLRELSSARRQRLINGYLFVNIAGFLVWQSWGLLHEQRLDFVELSFILHNLVFAAVVLLRRVPVAVDENPWHQVVAALAFLSGIAFIGEPVTGGEITRTVSASVVLAANLLGIAALLHLGKSFGILIASRGVKRHGVYGRVRHPMYLADILLRIGFLISHFTPLVIALALVSAGLYVYRALLEERFLSRSEEYRAYMVAVRYRFIPFVF